MDSVAGSAHRARPKCISIIICDQVIEDKRTNNKTVVGMFDEIRVPEFPAAHPRMFVMASLTCGHGRSTIAISIKDPSGQEILRLESDIDFKDPLRIADLIVAIDRLPLRAAGQHVVDVLADREPIAERRFNVREVKTSAHPRS